LVNGRVVRFNIKNEVKRYIEVIDGKPDDFGLTKIKGEYKPPKENTLGSILISAVVCAGLGLAVISDNDGGFTVGEGFGPQGSSNNKSN